MTEPRSEDGVVIVGGGIGGLSAALALAHAGHEVTVLEQAAEFVEVGAGIQLAPNATRALAELGVLEQALELADLPAHLVMMDAVDGRELTRLATDARLVERYGSPYVVMHRHDLLKVLLESCRAHAAVRLETGRRVTEIELPAGSARVTCEDGTSYYCGALVGADGLHSRLRPLVHEDEPVASPYVAYRGPVAAADVRGAGESHDVTVWVGPGLHLVQYPLRGGTLLNQVAVFRSDRYGRDGDDWGTPAELFVRFAEMHPRVAESIKLLNHEARWPMHDRLPINNWTRGVMTLLGDAAHPMLQYLAQGACQAIEDSVELARAFPAGVDPHAAFSAYQAIRIPRTARVQTTARSWGELWHLDGVGRALRNWVLRGHRYDQAQEIDWLFGQQSAGAVAWPLAEGASVAATEMPIADLRGDLA